MEDTGISLTVKESCRRAGYRMGANGITWILLAQWLLVGYRMAVNGITWALPVQWQQAGYRTVVSGIT